jgi:hypothetical protein
LQGGRQVCSYLLDTIASLIIRHAALLCATPHRTMQARDCGHCDRGWP